MTNQLLTNIGHITCAAGGISALRRLLTSLALNGKFTQASEVEAEILRASLPQLDALKKAYVESGKVSSRTAGASDSAKFSECLCPKGWASVNARDVFLSRSGNSKLIKGKLFSEASPNLFPGYSASGQDVWLDDFEHEGSAVIVSAVGARCGKAFLAAGRWSAIANTHIIWPVVELVMPEFAMLWLNDEAFWTRSGGAQPFIKVAETLSRTLPLPPLAEQHRIVAKVDELMALCDRLEADQADAEAAHAQLVQALLDSLTQTTDAADLRASWQRLSEHFHTLFTTEASIDALKQTVLQLAVMGKLVPHEVAGPEVARALPPGWCEQLINDFCTVQGGIQKTPLRRPVSLHFPYLRVANVQRGRIDVTELERYELTHDELAKWRLNKGDLLIVEGNGSENEIGRCAIWAGQVNDCVYQNHLMRVRPNVDEWVHYLAMYLNSPVGIGHMKRLAITTSGLFNLSVGKIRSIPVPLPPLAEQHRIVAKVDELLALCDQLKAQLAEARQQHAQLATVLVEQAVAA